MAAFARVKNVARLRSNTQYVPVGDGGMGLNSSPDITAKKCKSLYACFLPSFPTLKTQ